MDVRLSRRFRLGARGTLEPIVEIFNAFNRVNYVEINNVFGTSAFPSNPLPAFGQFLRAAPARQVQLAARVTF